MKEQIDPIHMNDSWDLTYIPHDKKKIGTKWAYKTKYNTNGTLERHKGTVERHKARLAAKGFTIEVCNCLWRNICKFSNKILS